MREHARCARALRLERRFELVPALAGDYALGGGSAVVWVEIAPDAANARVSATPARLSTAARTRLRSRCDGECAGFAACVVTPRFGGGASAEAALDAASPVWRTAWSRGPSAAVSAAVDSTVRVVAADGCHGSTPLAALS